MRLVKRESPGRQLVKLLAVSKFRLIVFASKKIIEGGTKNRKGVKNERKKIPMFFLRTAL